MPVTDFRQLPARLARLARRATIVLGRESAATARTSASAGSLTAATIPRREAGIRTRPASFRFGSGLIDAQSAAGDFFSVEAGHGLSGVVVIGHFHESKTTRLARLPVIYDVDTRNWPKGLKERSQIRFRGLKTHIAHKQILHFSSPDTN
jgi:hypothetical protein